ncbi:PqqD family peptide modification chaperone [Paenibacillus sp. strain BS8-2]
MDIHYDVIMPGDEGYTLSSYFHIIRLSKEKIVEDCHPGLSLSVLRLDLGRLYRFNETGGRIWELLREPLTAAEVVNALLIEYDIDRITCESEVFGFLAKLSKERLIQFGLSC